MRRRTIHGLPLGIEGVRVTPSLLGLIRDLINLVRAVWRRA